jgi:hypothetical protein
MAAFLLPPPKTSSPCVSAHFATPGATPDAGLEA